MVDESKIGGFITALRRERGMTQKGLADLLDVTDKAVSKWERGGGYPDITLIPKLSECLGVTPGELLNGARDSVPQAPQPPEVLVETTLRFADQVAKTKRRRASQIAAFILTVCCAVGIAVCMICDIAINRAFTWTVFPVSSILYGWLVVMPALWFRRYRLTMSLLSMSIFTLPFLLILERSVGNGAGWFFPVAVPCTLAGIAYLWVVCLCFISGRMNRYTAFGVAVLLAPLVDITVEFSIWRYVGGALWDLDVLISTMAALLLAGGLLFRGWCVSRREAEEA